MNLKPTEDEILLRDSIDKMISGHAARNVSPEEAQDGLWKDLCESGWALLAMPESEGGLGGSVSTVGYLLRRCAYYGLMTPYLSSIVMAARLLSKSSCPQYGKQLLQSALSGEAKFSLAVTDHKNNDSSKALHENGRWRIQGAKRQVLGASDATHLIFSATDKVGSPVIFILPADDPGVEIHSEATFRGEKLSNIRVDTTISGDGLVSSGSEAERLLQDSINYVLVSLCWEALGWIDWLCETTADYVKLRKQFGKPISEFQVIQHRIAEMWYQKRISEAAVQLASPITDDFSSLTRTSSMAKAVIGSAALYVMNQAVQLHGAMGVTEELPVGRYFRNLAFFRAYMGGCSVQVERYAEHVLKEGLEENSVIIGGC